MNLVTQPNAHPGRSGEAPVRQRILEAALATLRQGGGRRFTQTAVARQARVRQSHLTYYFPTRHDLLRATVLRFAESVGAGLSQAVCEHPGRGRHTPMARLIEAVAELEHMRMFLGLVSEAADDPGLRVIVVEGTERVEAALAAVLGGPRAAQDARIILATAWGLGLYRYAVRPPPERDPVPAALAALERGLPRQARGRRRVKG